MVEIFTWTVTRNGRVIRAKKHPFHFWIDDTKNDSASAEPLVVS